VEGEFSKLSIDHRIAKFDHIVSAISASEAFCESLFKRAEHIATTDPMARPTNATFGMLVMAQYNIAKHGGKEVIDCG
jgi:hypothetical protein